MYQKILIPLDGSPFAERILPYVERFITVPDTEIILLRVIEPIQSYIMSHEAMPLIEYYEDTPMREHAEAYLTKIKDELRNLGLRAHAQVMKGDVASSICDVANAQDIDLIAMTTHGRTGMSRWALGSVADRVIRTACQPIFLVRGTTEVHLTEGTPRILVPLDGSPLSERALTEAKVFAMETDATIVVVQAIEWLSDLEAAEIYASWKSENEIYEQRHKTATRYLQQVQEQLRTAGIASEIEVNEGHPAQVILDAAEEREIDLIVMSTRGRSGPARWIFGSVADKVLHETTHPLLLIRSGSELSTKPAAEDSVISPARA